MVLSWSVVGKDSTMVKANVSGGLGLVVVEVGGG